jgi:hypothetical protein
MIDDDFKLGLAHQLLARLEHLSADSYWAHRASGLRGSLLRCVEQIETARGKNQAIDIETEQKIDNLILGGFWILEKAAREIPVQEIDPGS